MRFKDYINEVTQAITSAATSIPQVAAALKKIPWKRGTVNLDLGGGKFDIATNYLKDTHGVQNLVYDPYNRTEAHNKGVLAFVAKHPPDTVTSTNVLNVIQEPEVRDALIAMAAKYAKSGGGVCYFSVHYDLKKSAGISKKTKDGTPISWQNHMHTKDYVQEIQKHFSNVSVSGDLITARV